MNLARTTLRVRVTRSLLSCVLPVINDGGSKLTVDADEATAMEREAFRESFDSFYERELSSVVGLAYVLSGSRSGAEDLAQEGFLAAYRHWDRIASFDDPGAWVRRVVANRAVSGYRRRKAELKALMKIGQHSFEILDMSQDAELIWDEVRRLPTRQAQTVALRYFDHRAIAEIARILECSENTVKTHLKRAKQTLAQRLEQEYQP